MSEEIAEFKRRKREAERQEHLASQRCGCPRPRPERKYGRRWACLACGKLIEGGQA